MGDFVGQFVPIAPVIGEKFLQSIPAGPDALRQALGKFAFLKMLQDFT